MSRWLLLIYYEMIIIKVLLLLYILYIVECSEVTFQLNKNVCDSKGQLFIIGGGKRPKSMMKELINVSHILTSSNNNNNNNNVVIITIASSKAEVGVKLKKEFIDLGVESKHIKHFHHAANEKLKENLLYIEKAKLIFLTGGKQSRFATKVIATPLHQAIRKAYKNGATVAGTSAGASVMSYVMMSFRGKKDVKQIQQRPLNPMQPEQGLGLINDVIIDQHFIKRQRMNRLIERALEHPSKICIGIDESTAILIKTNNVRVIGKSQVVVIKHPHHIHKSPQGQMLGGTNMNLNVYVPGDQFKLDQSCNSKTHTLINHNVKIERQNIYNK